MADIDSGSVPKIEPPPITPTISQSYYGITPDGVSFTPPIQQHNKMQVSLTVMMPEGASDIMLIHSAKNMGKENRSFSICSITALKGGGLEIIPKNPSINNFAPNQEYACRPTRK